MPIPVVRGLGAGCVLGLTLLTALPAFAAEKDELASAQRMLIQVQAALERARVTALRRSVKKSNTTRRCRSS